MLAGGGIFLEADFEKQFKRAGDVQNVLDERSRGDIYPVKKALFLVRHEDNIRYPALYK